jgi:hypothetical protein
MVLALCSFAAAGRMDGGGVVVVVKGPGVVAVPDFPVSWSFRVSRSL